MDWVGSGEQGEWTGHGWVVENQHLENKVEV